MKKVLVLLAQGFEAYEASVFVDVLGWNQLEGDCSTVPVTCGLRETVKCTWSFAAIPEVLAKDVDISDYAALAIPGGFEEAGFYEDAYSEEFLEIIRQFDKAGKTIATICVGALPVGKSGVLCGRKGTTYHLNNGLRQKQLAAFGVEILDQPIVIAQNVITSYGPATAMDVAFTLLESLTSVENCAKIKQLMGF